MKDFLHKIGFWMIVVFFLGIAVGGYGIYRFNDWQMDQSVKLKGFLFKGVVYNITERI